MIRPSCTREEKNKRKETGRILLSHGVVDFTSRLRLHGVEFAVQVY